MTRRGLWNHSGHRSGRAAVGEADHPEGAAVFTGIVELEELLSRQERPDAAQFTVGARLTSSDARAGDSISVNGVCLTVVSVQDGAFTADVIGETLRRSSLGTATPGDRINLERAAK